MSPRFLRLRTPEWAAALLTLVLMGLPGAAAWGQPPGGTHPPQAGAESGPRWQDLTPGQRSALKPLARDWAGIDAIRKQKWLDIADRYPSLPPAEQQRISGRMAEWVQMSPAERGRTRLNYQSARGLTPEERQARWQAYQALSPEQRSELARRAAPASGKPAQPLPRAQRDGIQTKSNLVPNPAPSAPRQLTPSMVQAESGATTSLISRRPAPPTHQQPGLPKIAATPGFVDKQTLLPQRGAQGAAVTPPPPASRSR